MSIYLHKYLALAFKMWNSIVIVPDFFYLFYSFLFYIYLSFCLPSTAKKMEPISIITVCKVSVNITAVNPPEKVKHGRFIVDGKNYADNDACYAAVF